MFRRSDLMPPLFDSAHWLPPVKREAIQRSWAGVFRERVLPLIDESWFTAAFCADNGRPNAPLRPLVALLVLKDIWNLTDREVLDAAHFNAQWQYAIGVDPSYSVSPRTLTDHRRRTLEVHAARVAFAKVTAGLAKLDGLELGLQRLDSTHIVSNMRRLNRLGLLVEATRRFLVDLQRHAAEKLAGVTAALRARYLDEHGYEDVDHDQVTRRLPVAARDMHTLLRRFEDDSEIIEWESFSTMARVFSEQCSVTESPDAPAQVDVRPAAQIGGASVQSPHDVDAGYGHKGKGYHGQITETADPANPYQVATSVAVNPANESDQKALIPALDAAAANGLPATTMLADAGYGSGDNIIAAAERGTELVAPVRDSKAPPAEDVWNEDPAKPESDENTSAKADEAEPAPVDLSAFAFNPTYNVLLGAPDGSPPTRQTAECAGFRAWFGASIRFVRVSGGGRSRREPDGGWSLFWMPARAATAHRKIEQRTAEFRSRYRRRSGSESTNSELKRRHGLGRLRERGRPWVTLSVTMKVLAMNVKRSIEYGLAQILKNFDQAGAESAG